MSTLKTKGCEDGSSVGGLRTLSVAVQRPPSIKNLQALTAEAECPTLLQSVAASRHETQKDQAIRESIKGVTEQRHKDRLANQAFSFRNNVEIRWGQPLHHKRLSHRFFNLIMCSGAWT